MTSLFDPERPRNGLGLPCWLGTQLVVPRPSIALAEDGTVCIELYLCDDKFSARLIRSEPIGDLNGFIFVWKANPELALKALFNEEPPGQQQTKTLADFGL